MNKVAIAFSTKDRVELSRRTIEPLVEGQHALFWIDGSDTEEGQRLPTLYPVTNGGMFSNVRGGADAAIAFALTAMLNHPVGYTHVGLVENDVLLHPDWFGPTMALFERGESDGLTVGAVSARCYQDRILIQRDGYAVCHNLGAGQVIYSREAAELVLRNFRTGWTPENRRVFGALSGLDIARWWAFGAGDHPLCADWQFDRILAEHGYASLALVPSPVEMIGQEPPLEQQGLRLATEPVELLRDDKAFARYRDALSHIGDTVAFPDSMIYQSDAGDQLVFPHQIGALGGHYVGNWRLKWSQGMGPFTWEAADKPSIYDAWDKPMIYPYVGGSALTVPVAGPCAVLVSGGRDGGKVEVLDTDSGYRMTPDLAPEGEQMQILGLMIPGGVTRRDIELRALTPGTRFYGLSLRGPQMWNTNWRFDHSVLPPTG